MDLFPFSFFPSGVTLSFPIFTTPQTNSLPVPEYRSFPPFPSFISCACTAGGKIGKKRREGGREESTGQRRGERIGRYASYLV